MDDRDYRRVLYLLFRGPVLNRWNRATLRKIIESETAAARRRLPAVDFTINERAQWKAQLDASTEGGRVAVCRSGMDCDCTKYFDVRITEAPASIVAWLRDHERHCEWLDGPESTWFDRPSNFVEGDCHESRDLILEAFEDGHPHVVYA